MTFQCLGRSFQLSHNYNYSASSNCHRDQRRASNLGSRVTPPSPFVQMKTKEKKIGSSPQAPIKAVPKKDYLKNPAHPYAFDHLHNNLITALSYQETMPFNSRKRKSSADETVEAEVPSTKRGRGSAGHTLQCTSKPQVDSDGNKFWEIAKARRVTISDYKSRKLVNIREYNEKDGQWLPGKKVFHSSGGGVATAC